MESLIGRKIVDVRSMTEEEAEREGWYGHITAPVLELEDGTTLFPSRDPEGNGPGALFGINARGHGLYVTPEK